MVRAIVRRHQRLAALWAAVAVLAGAPPAQSAGAVEPPRGAAYSTVTLGELPSSLVLLDQRGETVALATELDRPGAVYLNFIFTSCGAVCPVMTAIFSRLDKQLRGRGSEARLYSVSIDPLEDTPARLRDYAEEHRASPLWRFLTGTPAASEQVQRSFGAWRPDRMSHPVATFYRAYPGADWVRIEGFVSADELLARR